MWTYALVYACVRIKTHTCTPRTLRWARCPVNARSQLSSAVTTTTTFSSAVVAKVGCRWGQELWSLGKSILTMVRNRGQNPLQGKLFGGGGSKHYVTSGWRPLHEMEEAQKSICGFCIAEKFKVYMKNRQKHDNLCGWFQPLWFTCGPAPGRICFSLWDFSPIFCNYAGRLRMWYAVRGSCEIGNWDPQCPFPQAIPLPDGEQLLQTGVQGNTAFLLWRIQDMG